ncbi:MAG: TetR/AcrR family transcriptional regulator [Oscillospiraceae bacterium]|nr:TetR/AcrR family transcriptional regulator [Oscillospiraceae bacterium]
MNKREEHSQQRRIQILQIALDEFIAKGYYGVSTREISRIAGVSSGLMFHYFDSKQAVYEALVELGCEGMVFDYDETDTPIMIFKSIIADVFHMLEENPYSAKMFVFMGDAVHNAKQISPKAGEMFARHDIVRQSIPLIEKGQQLGEIRSGDPHALSVTFWCAIQGIAERIALNSDCPIPETEWVLDILRKK